VEVFMSHLILRPEVSVAVMLDDGTVVDERRGRCRPPRRS
jgi:hypothetical protein